MVLDTIEDIIEYMLPYLVQNKTAGQGVNLLLPMIEPGASEGTLFDCIGTFSGDFYGTEYATICQNLLEYSGTDGNVYS